MGRAKKIVRSNGDVVEPYKRNRTFVWSKLPEDDDENTRILKEDLEDYNKERNQA